METVRRIETAAGNMYTEKKVRGFCHESVGQASHFGEEAQNMYDHIKYRKPLRLAFPVHWSKGTRS
jgi:TPP-dependent pyruvate/acetoin dehydrogenase alpha subunit